MAESIDLDDKVVAIFDEVAAGESAVAELRGHGFEVEVLRGDAGRRRLDPHAEGEGFLESLGHALQTVVGDEDRIVDNVDSYLAEGRSFVLVDAESGGDASAPDILRKHGGHYMWRFDQWTYVPLGE